MECKKVEAYPEGMDVRIKRIYEAPDAADEQRVLIDRLWPRGVKKAEADIDLCLKDVAPSPELRKTWHADPAALEPAHFEAFAESYRDELSEGVASEAVDRLVALAHSSKRLTLLYGARNEETNHALVLRDAVLQRAR